MVLTRLFYSSAFCPFMGTWKFDVELSYAVSVRLLERKLVLDCIIITSFVIIELRKGKKKRSPHSLYLEKEGLSVEIQ